MQTVFKTNDGKIFDKLWQAQDWEKEHCPTKYYKVAVYIKIPAIVTVCASNGEEAIAEAKRLWGYEDLSEENYEVLEAEIDEEWEE